MSYASRELKFIAQRQAGVAPGPLGKQGCLAEGCYPWEQSKEGKRVLDHLKPSCFLQMSRQHITLGLHVRTYTTVFRKEKVIA